MGNYYTVLKKGCIRCYTEDDNIIVNTFVYTFQRRAMLLITYVDGTTFECVIHEAVVLVEILQAIHIHRCNKDVYKSYMICNRFVNSEEIFQIPKLNICPIEPNLRNAENCHFKTDSFQVFI